jgi:hypothetical protein
VPLVVAGYAATATVGSTVPHWLAASGVAQTVRADTVKLQAILVIVDRGMWRLL